jgi:hypothetical protein
MTPLESRSKSQHTVSTIAIDHQGSKVFSGLTEPSVQTDVTCRNNNKAAEDPPWLKVLDDDPPWLKVLDGDPPWLEIVGDPPATGPQSRNRQVTLPSHRQIPADRMAQVQFSQIRLIQRELDSGNLDLRTVFSACRGLDPASLEFKDTYMNTRISHMDTIKRDYPKVLHLHGMAVSSSDPKYPLGGSHLINCPRHLWQHFGIWLSAILGLELWNAWQLAGILDQYLIGGMGFLWLLVCFAFFMLDSLVWLRYRGKCFSRFTLPGAIMILTLFGLATGFHFYHLITTME